MGRSRENRGKTANILAETRARRERRRTRSFPAVAAASRRDTEHMIAEVPEGMSLLDALSAKRESAIATIAELESSISQIDAVMKMYDPKHVPWKAAANGTMPAVTTAPGDQSTVRGDDAGEVDRFFGTDERTAVVKKLMADAARSMSSAEIAEAYMDFKKKRLDKEPLQLLISRISAILSRLRKQGKVETAEKDGWKNSWRLS